MYKFILFLCLSFFILNAQAQENAENKIGSWYMFNGSHKLSKKYTLKTSFHVRYYELIGEFQQEIYRLGLNYKVNNKFNFTIGSVYSITDTSYKFSSPNLYEFRFYQDANLKDNWGNFLVTHRVRLAQLFKRQNFENKTSHRIRYGLFLKYPITKKLTSYAFNEIFINFAKNTFGKNRTGFGVVRKLEKKLRLRLGYMFTKINNSKSHRLQIGIILTTNHVKNEV